MEAAEASGRGRRRSLLTCRSVHSPGLLKARLPSSPRPCVPTSYENSRPRDDASGSNYLWPRKFADRLSLRNGSESLVPRQLYGDANPPPVKMTVNSALGVTTPWFHSLLGREARREEEEEAGGEMRSSPGGCGKSGDEPNSACLERQWQRTTKEDFSLLESGPRYVAILTASCFRTNRVSTFFQSLFLSLSLHIYMFRCEISNELEARILGRI